MADEIRYWAQITVAYKGTLNKTNVTLHYDGGLQAVTDWGSHQIRPAQEGKRWIRGHHGEETEQGRALLAAYALTK